MSNKKKSIYILMILFLVFFGFKTIVLAEPLTCDKLGRVKDDLQNIFDFCKIVIPILIIALSVFDFVKAITAKDDKDLKKAFNRLTKRIALAILFFFLPIIIELLLNNLFELNVDTCIE